MSQPSKKLFSRTCSPVHEYMGPLRVGKVAGNPALLCLLAASVPWQLPRSSESDVVSDIFIAAFPRTLRYVQGLKLKLKLLKSSQWALYLNDLTRERHLQHQTALLCPHFQLADCCQE